MSKSPVTDAELQAHVDGRLPPDRQTLVEAWLLAHPQEAARIASYRENDARLRDALAPIVDEPVPPSLDLGFRKVPKEGAGGRRQLLAAASAAGLLLIGGSGGWLLRGWNEPARTGTAALAREAVASYAVYANDGARPVELAADRRGALDNWFTQRLGRRVKAPDLTPAGLSLIGGRLVATEHGPAALYLYRDMSGRRIALYVRQMEVDRTDRMTPRVSGDVSGWTWADDGLGFGVFGTEGQPSLHGTANMVRAQMERA